MPTHVRVTVPASTANLGPGFDCLSLALQLHNTVELTVAAEGLDVRVEGEGADRLRRDRGNLIVRAADELCAHLKRPPLNLTVNAVNGVPLGSGLGSSAAAVVGGLVAANAVLDSPLSKIELLRLAYRIEGHPDNAAAALFGSLTLVSAADETLLLDRLDVPPLTVVIALPQVHMSTHEARQMLPKRVPLRDAVFNIGRAVFVVRALQTGDYEQLGRAMADRLHEPYRRGLIPGFDAAAQAAQAAGAVSVALSGAGPSLAAFAPDRHADIAAAMKAAFEARGVACRTFVLPVDPSGAQVSLL